MTVMGRIGRIIRAGGSRLAGRAQPTEPLVSVVVPVYNVEAYLASTIDSVLDQRFADFELILVDDGSTDRSRRIALRKALGDARVRRINQRNAGPGPARELGIRHARGKYLAFLDSDDLLPPDALGALVDSAEKTGSEIAVGAFRRFDGTRVWVPEWVGELHGGPTLRTTLDATPKLLRNNYPCGKIFRRDFWSAQRLGFLDGVIYEDQPLIALMFARASSIDVLDTITYDYRARQDRSSISQRPEELRDLRDRVAAWRRSLDSLRREGVGEAVLAAWYWTLYATHFHWYLDNDAIDDDEYWSILRAALLAVEEHEPDDARAEVTAERRAALSLLASGRKEELLQFRASGAYRCPSDYFVGADASGVEYGFVVDVPLTERTTAPPAARVQHLVERGEFDDEASATELRLSGFARIRGVPDTVGVSVRIELTGRRTGAAATVFEQCAEGGRFDFTVGLGPLADDTYEFSATVEVNHLRIQVGLGHPAEWLAADGMVAHGADRRYRLERDPNPHVPLRLTVVGLTPPERRVRRPPGTESRDPQR
ncbi:glycosyltransferase family 2 protein [Agromyces sp. NPDC058126]|uniref:glycosyltransferase family 2 protein n=1 Tax=Agromyces sp. NPDC058126 TaxID=3346350 RepID=UPI0036D8B836